MRRINQPERVNVFGNSYTIEKVIRNNLFIDEGDPYNEILANKSINQIKSLRIFKTVNSKIEGLVGGGRA